MQIVSDVWWTVISNDLYSTVGSSGSSLLHKLAAWWTHFFHAILPVIRLIFQPVHVSISEVFCLRLMHIVGVQCCTHC